VSGVVTVALPILYTKHEGDVDDYETWFS
jgi:hypothetical protein